MKPLTSRAGLLILAFYVLIPVVIAALFPIFVAWQVTWADYVALFVLGVIVVGLGHLRANALEWLQARRDKRRSN